MVDDTDAIVRVDATTICGSDLHILKGDLPEVTTGRILGYEAVGTVEQVGAAVKNVHVGDRVLVSCISACGTCRFCRQSRFGQCLNGGGWILGHNVDGTQAEKVRVPFADTSTYPVPAGVDDDHGEVAAGDHHADGKRSHRMKKNRRQVREARLSLDLEHECQFACIEASSDS